MSERARHGVLPARHQRHCCSLCSASTLHGMKLHQGLLRRMLRRLALLQWHLQASGRVSNASQDLLTPEP